MGFNFNMSDPAHPRGTAEDGRGWRALALGAALLPARTLAIWIGGIAAVVALAVPGYYLVKALTGSWFFAQADWLPGPGLVMPPPAQ